MDFCELETNLVYIVPGQPGLFRETLSHPVSKNWGWEEAGVGVRMITT